MGKGNGWKLGTNYSANAYMALDGNRAARSRWTKAFALNALRSATCGDTLAWALENRKIKIADLIEKTEWHHVANGVTGKVSAVDFYGLKSDEALEQLAARFAQEAKSAIAAKEADLVRIEESARNARIEHEAELRSANAEYVAALEKGDESEAWAIFEGKLKENGYRLSKSGKAYVKDGAKRSFRIGEIAEGGVGTSLEINGRYYFMASFL